MYTLHVRKDTYTSLFLAYTYVRVWKQVVHKGSIVDVHLQWPPYNEVVMHDTTHTNLHMLEICNYIFSNIGIWLAWVADCDLIPMSRVSLF